MARKEGSLEVLNGRGILARTLVFVTCFWLAQTPILALDADKPTDVLNHGEILWDAYDVPHIYGDDLPTVLRGYGFAQMEAHAELILQQVAVSRGRAAEYFGAGENNAFVTSDMQIRTFGIPGRASEWLVAGGARQRRLIEAFVSGVNQYAHEHGDTISPVFLQVLPVTAEDVLASIQARIHFTFLSVQSEVPQLIAGWQDGTITVGKLTEATRLAMGTKMPSGSNGWAISPRKTENGHAILMGNPHLPWGTSQPIPGLGLYQWFEAHLVTKQLNGHGVSFVGGPFFGIGFTDHIGWTHTNNWIKNADLYELTLNPDGTYVWETGALPLSVRHEQVKIRQADGSLVTQALDIYSSIHGPIVAQKNNKALALKVAGLNAPNMVTQYLDMLQAENLTEFAEAESRLQMPFFNTIFADRDGDIMYAFGGRQPVRQGGTFSDWAGILPGHQQSALWTDTLKWRQLPKAINPPGGFVQNANDPPWTSTFPQVLHPKDYPSYLIGPAMALRPQHAAKFLSSQRHFSMAEVIAGRESTAMELAPRLLPDLIKAAKASGDPLAMNAAEVLKHWAKTGYLSDANSRGAALFELWYRLLTSDPNAPKGASLDLEGNAYPKWVVDWSETKPLATPHGLADPAAAVPYLISAAQGLQQAFGRIDVAFGDVHRAELVTHDPTFTEVIPVANVPVSGSASVFGGLRIVWPFPSPDGVHQLSYGGDSYVQVVEFARHGVKAKTLLTYGNSSRPGSSHIADQLPLYGNKQMRDVPRTRQEVEASAVRSETY